MGTCLGPGAQSDTWEGSFRASGWSPASWRNNSGPAPWVTATATATPKTFPGLCRLLSFPFPDPPHGWWVRLQSTHPTTHTGRLTMSSWSNLRVPQKPAVPQQRPPARPTQPLPTPAGQLHRPSGPWDLRVCHTGVRGLLHNVPPILTRVAGPCQAATIISRHRAKDGEHPGERLRVWSPCSHLSAREAGGGSEMWPQSQTPEEPRPPSFATAVAQTAAGVLTFPICEMGTSDPSCENQRKMCVSRPGRRQLKTCASFSKEVISWDRDGEPPPPRPSSLGPQ